MLFPFLLICQGLLPEHASSIAAQWSMNAQHTAAPEQVALSIRRGRKGKGGRGEGSDGNGGSVGLLCSLCHNRAKMVSSTYLVSEGCGGGAGFLRRPRPRRLLREDLRGAGS